MLPPGFSRLDVTGEGFLYPQIKNCIFRVKGEAREGAFVRCVVKRFEQTKNGYSIYVTLIDLITSSSIFFAALIYLEILVDLKRLLPPGFSRLDVTGECFVYPRSRL